MSTHKSCSSRAVHMLRLESDIRHLGKTLLKGREAVLCFLFANTSLASHHVVLVALFRNDGTL